MTQRIPLTRGFGAQVNDEDYAHRLIMKTPPGTQVDHIHRDPLDNRRANLRCATRSQNQANKRLQSNTS